MDIYVRGRKDSHQGFRAKLTQFHDRYYWKNDVPKEDTHWYRFQEAVKEHQVTGIRLLRPLLEQIGVDINSA